MGAYLVTWIKLSDDWQDHIKIIRAGRDGRDLWLAGLTFSNRNTTGGYIANDDLTYIAAKSLIAVDPSEIVARLVRVGLWEPVDGGWQMHDYYDWNQPIEKIEAIAEARSEAGRMGGIRSGQARRAHMNEGSEANEAKSNQIASRMLPKSQANRSKIEAKHEPRIPVPGSGLPEPEESTNSHELVAPAGAAMSMHDVMEDFIKRCSAATKKAGIIGEAFQYVFGGGDRPNYGRLARLKMDAGGENKLIRLMFQAGPTWDQYGDAHDYLTRVIQNANRAPSNGHSSHPINRNIVHADDMKASSNPRTDHSDVPVNPEWERAARDQEEAQKEERKRRTHENRLRTDPVYRQQTETRLMRESLAMRKPAEEIPVVAHKD